MPATVNAHGLTVAERMSVLPISSMHRRIVWSVGMGLFFDMYEIFLAGVIKPVLHDEWNLAITPGPNDRFGGAFMSASWILASAFLGMFLGALVLGRLADRIGRRRSFLLNLAIYGFFCLVSIFSMNVWFLIITRFLAGVGIGAQMPLGDTYYSDTLPAKDRGRLAAWGYTASFVGVPVVGLLAMWLADERWQWTPTFTFGGWRLIFLVGAVGAFITLWAVSRIPESPRWLESVGRHDEAERGLAEFIDDPKAAESAFVVEAAAKATRPATSEPKLPLRALIHKPFGKRFGMLVIFHLLQSVGYYGFGTMAITIQVLNGESFAKGALYTALSYFGYPLGSLLAVPLMKRFERKYLVIATTIVLAGLGICYGFSREPALITIFGLLYTALSNVFSDSYHVYQSEIFPTSIRSTAASWTYSLSRFSAGVAPFLLLPLLYSTYPRYGGGILFLVVAVILLLVALDVAVFGPKTLDRSVEDINHIDDADLAALLA
jgi:putative MFS transporter